VSYSLGTTGLGGYPSNFWNSERKLFQRCWKIYSAIQLRDMCGVNTMMVIIQNLMIKFINTRKYLSVYTITLLILNLIYFNKVDREFM
jgi:hypothetical protein